VGLVAGAGLAGVAGYGFSGVVVESVPDTAGFSGAF